MIGRPSPWAAAGLALLLPAFGAAQLRYTWGEGVRWTGAGGRHGATLQGRLEVEAGAGRESRALARAGHDFPEWQDLRRARLRLDARTGSSLRLGVLAEFAGWDVQLRRLFLGAQDLPWVGTVRAGYLTEPFGLERTTPTRHRTLTERSSAHRLAPGRNWGALVRRTFLGRRVQAALGAFLESEGHRRVVARDRPHLTARITGTPWRGARGLWHLGASLSHRRHPRERTRYRAGPEVEPDLWLVDTGTLEPSEGALVAGGETALVLGAWNIRAEYQYAAVDYPAGGDPGFHGGYVQVAWLLTGGRREYRAGRGTFGDLVADNSWEAVARWSALDLDRGRVLGGRLHTLTLGLNWHLNPWLRIMCNYLHTEVDGRAAPTGGGDLVVLRCALLF